MTELTTGVELLAPSGLTLRLLGPTADYLGSGIRAWSEARVQNIRGILDKAGRKLDPESLSESGAVAPRVLRGILNDGSFVTDELAQDYFGGVLASSHSHHGRDDRAATYTELLSRLSTYQIRVHYLLYQAGSEIDLVAAERRNARKLARTAQRDAEGGVIAGQWDKRTHDDVSARHRSLVGLRGHRTGASKGLGTRSLAAMRAPSRPGRLHYWLRAVRQQVIAEKHRRAPNVKVDHPRRNRQPKFTARGRRSLVASRAYLVPATFLSLSCETPSSRTTVPSARCGLRPSGVSRHPRHGSRPLNEGDAGNEHGNSTGEADYDSGR